MPSSPDDAARLAALIEAARAEAERLGDDAAGVLAGLDTALAAAHARPGAGGKPDQGLRPDELTTANDQ